MCVFEDLKEILNADYKSNGICNYVLTAKNDEISEFLMDDYIQIKNRMIMNLRMKKIKVIFNNG